MVGFVLTGHGDFAQGLYSSIEMIAGEQKEFDVVTFHDADAANFPGELRQAIAGSLERNGKVVVFCDLQGGTPFNQAMLISADLPGVEVLAGTNLPMLIEAAMDRNFDDDVDALVSQAIESGREGVAHATLEPADTSDAGDEDGI